MDPISQAFAATPRAAFLHEQDRNNAGYDGPIPIGGGQTNSQPRTVHNMLALLDVRPGQRVLDVGSGSGWTTALLAQVVGSTGRVLGLEIRPELAAWGASNLAGCQRPWASIRRADPGVLGAPAKGPFDRILVSAMPDELPPSLVDQLGAGGRMVIPVAGVMMLVERSEDGATRTSEHGYYSFVPLLVPELRSPREAAARSPWRRRRPAS